MTFAELEAEMLTLGEEVYREAQPGFRFRDHVMTNWEMACFSYFYKHNADAAIDDLILFLGDELENHYYEPSDEYLNPPERPEACGAAGRNSKAEGRAGGN